MKHTQNKSYTSLTCIVNPYGNNPKVFENKISKNKVEFMEKI
jgi:hypothetical protein